MYSDELASSYRTDKHIHMCSTDSWPAPDRQINYSANDCGRASVDRLAGAKSQICGLCVCVCVCLQNARRVASVGRFVGRLLLTLGYSFVRRSGVVVVACFSTQTSPTAHATRDARKQFISYEYIFIYGTRMCAPHCGCRPPSAHAI